MKDKITRKCMTEFVALRPKTYYSMDDGNCNKKAKGTTNA